MKFNFFFCQFRERCHKLILYTHNSERQSTKMKITVGSSDKYFSTIKRIWSSRKTPNVCTKFWSSCVKHVQIEIMLPLPTRLARTSISVNIWREKEIIIVVHRLFKINHRKKKQCWKITLVLIIEGLTFPPLFPCLCWRLHKLSALTTNTMRLNDKGTFFIEILHIWSGFSSSAFF